MKVDRLQRLLYLVTILQGGTEMSAADLAEELGVSRRTLFRDLKILEEAGVPAYYKPGLGYRISPCFFLPPVTLNASEAMGLMLMAQTASGQENQPFTPPAIRAIRKLLAMMNEPVREVCNDMIKHITVTPGESITSGQVEHFPALLKAIDEQREVEVVFADKSRHRLRPVHLCFAHGQWHVLGHGRDQNLRIDCLRRIGELTLTETRFKVNAAFSPEKHFKRVWRLRPEGRMYEIELEFSPEHADRVLRSQWHPTQKVKKGADGVCRVRFRIDGLKEIAEWIWLFGEGVVVCKPAALRKMIEDNCRAVLSRYNGSPLPEPPVRARAQTIKRDEIWP
ncbi:MAG: YafY family protein [Phycisphaeraceae bacterium]|nr:YafY family protein [Phycisphaeraceae bacterium]